jgi:transcriptional regulator with XRE-family HTH domain
MDNFTSPGIFLKEVRLRLQLGLRDTQQMSSKIAAREHNKRFYISAARLNQIENDGAIPSPFKIFTLAAIYGVPFHDILSPYGVDPDRVHRYRSQLKLSATRLISSEVYNLNAKVMVPVRLDPTFKWESTQLINRAVALWGEIPAAFLIECNPKRHMYAYIGLEDHTMGPLLRPGSLVMIDEERRHVTSSGWTSEYDRPIYLIELREGYICGWCQTNGSRITVVPHPVSKVPVRTFNLASEAEVIGQVVSVATRLVPITPANQERGTIPLERS